MTSCPRFFYLMNPSKRKKESVISPTLFCFHIQSKNVAKTIALIIDTDAPPKNSGRVCLLLLTLDMQTNTAETAYKAAII